MSEDSYALTRTSEEFIVNLTLRLSLFCWLAVNTTFAPAGDETSGKKETVSDAAAAPDATAAAPSAVTGDAAAAATQSEPPKDKRLGALADLNGYFPFAPPATREAWAARAAELRRQVLVSTGLWPMPKRVISKPVVHGRVDRDGYSVEKVFFESYPGYFVTGSLYRPKDRSGKLPAILSPHGHWPGGRFHDAGPKEIRQQIVEGAERFEVGGRHPLQARCVQLARMGCVVFHYDMVDYADSKQLEHRAGDRAEMDNPRQWGFFSPQAEARLQTIFGLQAYNSIRALDFLSELPDVDTARIGVTGASGGGTQTFILGAVDGRPAVFFPAVMVSTAMQGGCPCESGPYLRIGTGNIELAGLAAPKPLGMTAADDWTKEIATKGLPELKQLYRLLGVEDRVMAKPLLQFPHNYNYVSRAVMYSWFNKHLKLGLEEPVVEEDYRPLSVEEMSVWDAKHPAPASGPEFERSLLERMTADAEGQIESLAPKDEASLREYRRIVGGALEVMIGRGLPEPGAVEVADTRSEELGSCRVIRFHLRYPAYGEELPAVRIEPTEPSAWNRRMVIWIDRLGKKALFTDTGSVCPSVLKLLEKGYAVVGADLIGQGEFTSDGVPWAKARMNRSKHASASERWGSYAGYTFGYNHSLFAQRVHDVLSLVAYARSGQAAAENVDLLGLGGAGHWAAVARAVAQAAVDRAAIDTGGFRFANLTAIDDPDFLPGGAKYGDLSGMIALAAPGRLWVAGEGNGEGSVLSAAYAAAGQANTLTFQQAKDKEREGAAVEWLLKE
jgi:dienelactone hydrolase